MRFFGPVLFFVIVHCLFQFVQKVLTFFNFQPGEYKLPLIKRVISKCRFANSILVYYDIATQTILKKRFLQSFLQLISAKILYNLPIV